MRYPMIGRQAVREIGVPKLSGGLNLRDSLTGVRDNQLTDCVNMWFKNGMLKTRPPFITDSARVSTLKQSDKQQKLFTRFHNNIKLFYDGFDCVCATNLRTFTNQSDETVNSIDFEFQSAEKTFAMPSIIDIKGEKINYFLAHFENSIYCYVSDFSIYKLEYNKSNTDSKETPSWQQINLDECYIPTVMTHCKALNGEIIGTQLDGFNTLTNSFKMIYSTVNMKALNDNKVSMEYPLVTISSLKHLKDSTFKAKHTKLDGTVTEHIVVYNSESTSGTYYENVSSAPKDKLYMYVRINGNKATVGFSESKDSSVAAKLSDSDFVEDNLEITVVISNKENLNLNKIFGAQSLSWFGGTGGIYSGSRLFLGANKEDSERALVVWSDFNNPLYFPENCYAYVGDKSYRVTAFAKQDDKLIIFKENEIYYTYYVYNGVSADSLINQTVVDYQANVAVFPMILINASVGCDCPDSVQLCRNRLVWASSEGRVFTLCKMNQYDEHTVYEISEMIRPKLKQYKDRLKTATSADFDGHYILFLDDCAFVCDYNSYGYQYVYSYSKTDDANALIPWYYWDFSFLKNYDENDEYEQACICTGGEALLMRAYFNASQNEKKSFVCFSMNEDITLPADRIFYNDFSENLLKFCESAIGCRVTTKLFELGGGNYSFNVETVVLKCGSNNGEGIDVELLSELGQEKTTILSKREHKAITDTNFIIPKRINPTMKSILKLAIKLECDGLLTIDGLSLQYRLLGGAK